LVFLLARGRSGKRAAFLNSASDGHHPERCRSSEGGGLEDRDASSKPSVCGRDDFNMLTGARTA
jgi:hypothetical protein